MWGLQKINFPLLLQMPPSCSPPTPGELPRLLSPLVLLPLGQPRRVSKGGETAPDCGCQCAWCGGGDLGTQKRHDSFTQEDLFFVHRAEAEFANMQLSRMS